MSVTEQDQKRAVALLRAAAADGLIQDTEPRHQPAMVERIAAALAEERERARAPFLRLADEADGDAAEIWLYPGETHPMAVIAADRIRRVVKHDR